MSLILAGEVRQGVRIGRPPGGRPPNCSALSKHTRPGRDHDLSSARAILSGLDRGPKRIVREQLMKLKIFDLLVRLIKVQEDQCLPSEDLIRELQIALPPEVENVVPHAP